MPHKHKRLKTGHESQHFNLPPTSRAKALPVSKHAARSSSHKNSLKGAGTKTQDGFNDTPKAFVRLMQLRQTGKGPRGLDEGRSKSASTANKIDPSKKRMQGKEVLTAAAGTAEQMLSSSNITVPKIQPGERLGDYAARVDQALPISGLIKKEQTIDGVREHRQTKHEKKLQRLVNNWKAEEKRRLEKLQETWDESEERDDEDRARWEGTLGVDRMSKSRSKGAQDGDPWAELKNRRDKPKGIFDVAQAPPQFKKPPKDFKAGFGGTAQASKAPRTTSLRRQEILRENRQEVIKRYREMMLEKRAY